MIDKIKQVEFLLKSYPAMKREISVLEFELESFTASLDPKAIEALVFARPGMEWVSGSYHSDKTADIVVEHVDRQQSAKYHALKNAVYNIRLEMRRLEHYLSLLPEDEANTIRWYYFEGQSWESIEGKVSVTKKTLHRRRRRSLEKLAGYYSTVDKLSAYHGDARMKARFIGYVHEEQFVECLDRLKPEHRTPGVEAMLYIISGCNELWNIGPSSFIDFETGKIIPLESMTESFSIQGAKLLRLTYCYAQGMSLAQLPHVLNSYFPDLEHLHLELAIEGMRLALFAGV